MEIPLTNGGITVIDDADYPLVSTDNWRWITGRGSLTRYAESRRRRMHRVIMGVSNPRIFVDHINHDGLDNRRANLRLASPTESQRNRPLSKSNTSGFKGVYFHKYHRRWQAQICINYELLLLGRYSTALEAAHAYDDAARFYFGQFAWLNFSPPTPP